VSKRIEDIHQDNLVIVFAGCLTLLAINDQYLIAEVIGEAMQELQEVPLGRTDKKQAS